jgi:hypothetical protein
MTNHDEIIALAAELAEAMRKFNKYSNRNSKNIYRISKKLNKLIDKSINIVYNSTAGETYNMSVKDV